MSMKVKYVMDRVETLRKLHDKLTEAPRNVDDADDFAKAVEGNLTYDDLTELASLVNSQIADYLNMEVKNGN